MATSKSLLDSGPLLGFLSEMEEHPLAHSLLALGGLSCSRLAILPAVKLRFPRKRNLDGMKSGHL
jgi:hypothetical protein